MGKQRDELYYLVALATKKSLTNHSSSTNQPACNLAIFSTNLWHSRLGHVSHSHLSFIAKNFLNFYVQSNNAALYVFWLSKVVYFLVLVLFLLRNLLRLFIVTFGVVINTLLFLMPITKDKNIGNHGYIGNLILRIYRKNIEGYFEKKIRYAKI